MVKKNSCLFQTLACEKMEKQESVAQMDEPGVAKIKTE